jgi:hypothetical protein
LTYRVLIEMYVHPGMALAALVGGVSVSSKLLDVGSAASMVFGRIPWSIAFIALIHLLMEAAEVQRQERDIWQPDFLTKGYSQSAGIKNSS